MNNQNLPTVRIEESFVKNTAIKFLSKKYEGSFLSKNSVVAYTEVYTKDGNWASGVLPMKGE